MILDQQVIEEVDLWLVLWPRDVGTPDSVVCSLGHNVKVSGRYGWIPRYHVVVKLYFNIRDLCVQ